VPPRQWLFLVSLALVVCASAAGAAVAIGAAPAAAAAQLRTDLPEAALAFSRATGVARFVRLPARSRADLAPGHGATPEARVRGFLAAHAALFGIRDAGSEVALLRSTTDGLGDEHLVFRQLYRNLPVFGARLRAHFDATGRLRAVEGTFVPGIELDVEPEVDAGAAVATAREFFASQLAGGASSPFAAPPALVVYRNGLERPGPGVDRLAWSIEVSGAGGAGSARARVFVDAASGKVIDWLSETYDALFRRAYSGRDQTPFDGIPDSFPQAPDWSEGDPYPTGIAELDDVLAATEDTARVYAALGRDGYDGASHVFDLSWNSPNGCPNASWNGRLATFCSGFAVHDVVAHEWSHAFTEWTSDLIYRWQSGALDESFSDLWGEAIDQSTRLPGVRDTDRPDQRRSTGSCSSFVAARLRIASPATLAGDDAVGQAAFGAAAGPSPELDVVAVVDTGGADPHDACEPLADTRVAGRLAFADRGDCDFQTQAENVQAAGGAGLVIGNLAGSPHADVPPAMGCDPIAACDSTLTIPVVSLALADSDRLRAALAAGGARAAILGGSNSGSDDSVRWLLGEDVRPVGVARDMWSPECLGAPGRISDPEYACGAADGGGVHTNSGVPNHAFALLVDGGTAGGATVSGIGLAKSAQIYWRAESVYEGPATDFAAHADALEAACDDLVGARLADPWGGGGVTISPDDCLQVSRADAAVGLRGDPPCDFAHLLDPATPPLCGAGTPYPLFEATFDDGAAGWRASRRAVRSPERFAPRDWHLVASLPQGRAGSAFFAPDPRNGSCVSGDSSDDQSGVLVLESPDLLLPVGGPARLVFDQEIATEENWDGGNLKLSVDGRPWQLVPASAFVFNGYRNVLYEPPADSDPLAGEPAFDGIDPGSNSGSWGTSIVDLAGLVSPGHRFRVRFELGSDACYGSTLGWWIDDVRLVACTGLPKPLFLDGFETGDVSRWLSATPASPLR
jgi:Zn-dependent metalloprotease